MKVSNNLYNPNFKAKFLYTKALEDTAKYAVEQNKFDALNNARINISKAMLTVRLKMDCGRLEDGHPYVSFVTYTPKPQIVVPKTEADYIISKPVVYRSEKAGLNPFKYALNVIIKMANDVPKNKVFKKVVYNKKV